MSSNSDFSMGNDFAIRGFALRILGVYFYVFLLSLLGVYLLFSGCYILSCARCAVTARTNRARAGRTSLEKQQLAGLAEQDRNTQTSRFLWNLGITLVAVLLFHCLVHEVVRDGSLASFDPYEVLGVNHGASTSAIRKAYRNLALLYHPDKHSGAEEATSKFFIISRAYEQLAEEKTAA